MDEGFGVETIGGARGGAGRGAGGLFGVFVCLGRESGAARLLRHMKNAPPARASKKPASPIIFDASMPFASTGAGVSVWGKGVGLAGAVGGVGAASGEVVSASGVVSALGGTSAVGAGAVRWGAVALGRGCLTSGAGVGSTGGCAEGGVTGWGVSGSGAVSRGGGSKRKSRSSGGVLPTASWAYVPDAPLIASRSAHRNMPRPRGLLLRWIAICRPSPKLQRVNLK